MGLYEMFDDINDLFDEIDEEMCLVLDSVSAIKEMVEKGQKKKALEALKDLEAELEDFLAIPEGEDEEWEDEEEEEENDEEHCEDEK